MTVKIDGKEYDETKFSPELHKLYNCKTRASGEGKTRLTMEIEKVDVLTAYYNKRITDLLKEETNK